MKNKALLHALRETAAILGDGTRVTIGSLALPVAVPAVLAGVAAFSAAALGTWLATTAGRTILDELRRRARLRAPRPPSPSLRGTPTPKELADDALCRPRTLAIRLRIGSRLADLAPTLDTDNRYDISPTGAKRIAGRGRGVKGWMEDNRIPLNYSTLMRYKRLAVRLRALLALDERLPLEWLLPKTPPTFPVPPDLLSQYTAARRRLTKLLRAHWNFSRLREYADNALGIPRLPRLQGTRGAAVCIPDFEGTRLENTKRELIAFLRDSHLPPRQEKLRRSALECVVTRLLSAT